MLSRLFLIRLFLIIGVLLFLSTACYRPGKKTSELVSAYDIPQDEIIAYDEEESAPFQGISLKGTDCLVVDSKNDTLRLTDILPENAIVGRYSVYSCKDCVDFMINGLLNYSRENPDSSVVVLLKDVYYRDLHVIANGFPSKITFYVADSIPTDFEEAIIPYLFRTDSTLKVVRHFIPRKEIPNRLLNYLGLDRYE